MARFQTVITRARFVYSPYTSEEMQGFAQVLADSTRTRIQSGQNICNQPAAPLKPGHNGRRGYPDYKAARGLQPIRHGGTLQPVRQGWLSKTFPNLKGNFWNAKAWNLIDSDFGGSRRSRNRNAGGPAGALLGAGIGAATGLGIGLGEKLAGVESPVRQAHGGSVSVAVRSPSVRQFVMLYSEATGQKMPLSATTPMAGSQRK
jgi:hypothetical protein